MRILSFGHCLDSNPVPKEKKQERGGGKGREMKKVQSRLPTSRFPLCSTPAGTSSEWEACSWQATTKANKSYRFWQPNSPSSKHTSFLFATKEKPTREFTRWEENQEFQQLPFVKKPAVSTVNKSRWCLQKEATKKLLTGKNNVLFWVCCCRDRQGLALDWKPPRCQVYLPYTLAGWGKCLQPSYQCRWHFH